MTNPPPDDDQLLDELGSIAHKRWLRRVLVPAIRRVVKALFFLGAAFLLGVSLGLSLKR